MEEFDGELDRRVGEKLTQAAYHWDQVDRLVKGAMALNPDVEKIEIRGHHWPPEPVRGPTVKRVFATRLSFAVRRLSRVPRARMRRMPLD